MSFAYFIAIALLFPAIGFTRASLLEQPLSLDIVDVAIAAFVAYSGRTVFGRQSVESGARGLIGRIFYGILVFVVLLLYVNLLTARSFPTFEQTIIISITGCSLALATAGEKLFKISMIRSRLEKASSEEEKGE